MYFLVVSWVFKIWQFDVAVQLLVLQLAEISIYAIKLVCFDFTVAVFHTLQHKLVKPDSTDLWVPLYTRNNLFNLSDELS